LDRKWLVLQALVADSSEAGEQGALERLNWNQLLPFLQEIKAVQEAA
jgi:hypothetical protein